MESHLSSYKNFMLIIKSLSFMLFIRIVSKICVLQNLRRKNELLEYLVNYVHTIVIIVVFYSKLSFKFDTIPNH